MADAGLRGRLSNVPKATPSSLEQIDEPCLFVVDTSFLWIELNQLIRLLRLRCPGSKFLALVSPERCSQDDMLRLLYAGVDGIASLADDLQRELPVAVHTILGGSLWVPPHVLTDYLRQTNLFLDKQLQPDLCLTARENQILQLVLRRLSNKEIAGALQISERTVKFHVSNIFTKLQVGNRRELLATTNFALQTEPLIP
jgi:DNA-binding NarL/FixJ family response regulator